MAAGDITFFDDSMRTQLIGWAGTDIIKCALVTNTPAPTAADVDPELLDYTELSDLGGSYTAGGESLGTWTALLTEAAGVVKYDTTSDPMWTQNALDTTDPSWGIIYNSSQVGNPCLAYVELGGPIDLTLGSLTIVWNAAGIATITKAA